MKKVIILTILLLFPFFAFASFENNLYYGLQNNNEVRELQEFLVGKGLLDHEATGNFYSLTLKAVKAYQASEGIIQTGYVGTLTRTAINNELITSLSASNQESTNETGAIPPVPTPQATTNDVVATLQAQIALLLQQVQAMQTQQTTVQQLQQTVQQQAQTIQQIQQNTQQIAQNTTPPVIMPTIEPIEVSCEAVVYVSPGKLVPFNKQTALFNLKYNLPVKLQSIVSGGIGNYEYSWFGLCSGSEKECNITKLCADVREETLTVKSGDQTKSVVCKYIPNDTTTCQ